MALGTVSFRAKGSATRPDFFIKNGMKVARQPAKTGTRQAAQFLAKEAKGEAPVETKTLQKALGSKVGAFKNNMGYWGIAGARKDAGIGIPYSHPRFARFLVRRSRWSKNAYWNRPDKYLHLVEGGTQPHAVGRGSSLKTGVQVGIRHPGAKANAFMERTYKQSMRNAQAIVARAMRAAVLKGGQP